MENISLIGTGALGTPIARRLINTGFVTTVYDVRPEALDPLVKMGAKRANSISDCTGSEAILIVVANDNQVEDVIVGPAGILNNLNGEMHPVIVVMSTVLPETVRRLAASCQKRGLEIIDAPISGGHVAAQSGNLSIMIGGESETFEKIRIVLSAIGKRLYHVGKLGAGETMKLINNMMGVANMWLTMEALATGVRSGLSLDTLLSIIDASSGSNFYIRNWEISKTFFSDVAKDPESSRSNLSLSIKDLSHARELTELSGRASPVLTGIINALKELTPQDVVDQWSAVLEEIRRG